MDDNRTRLLGVASVLPALFAGVSALATAQLRWVFLGEYSFGPQRTTASVAAASAFVLLLVVTWSWAVLAPERRHSALMSLTWGLVVAWGLWTFQDALWAYQTWSAIAGPVMLPWFFAAAMLRGGVFVGSAIHVGFVATRSRFALLLTTLFTVGQAASGLAAQLYLGAILAGSSWTWDGEHLTLVASLAATLLALLGSTSVVWIETSVDRADRSWS